MSIAAKRRMNREMRLQSRIHYWMQLAPIMACEPQRRTFTQAELDNFVRSLPPGVLPWPAFTDDQNPQ